MDFIALERSVTAANYDSLPVVLREAKGVWATDTEGRRYLDMMSAYSAVSLGHGHPRILKAMMEQASKLAVTSRAYHTELLGPFLERLVQITGLDMALPMNTGAEAVETAIKAARRWGYAKKKIAQDRAEIIVANNNFHGRTTTIVGFSSDESYREGFGPFSGGFKLVPFGDAGAIEQAITGNTCAVLIEPIQGEAGIVVPPEGYLRDLRAICDRHNVLLMLDEVQSGLGRTGRWFAYQHEGIKPDGLILGKALGGGVYPVSAFVGTHEVMSVFNPGSHGSTFGGNALAARIGLEALAVIEEEHLVERSAEMGGYLQDRLRAMRSNIVKEVRGRGLWVGVEVDANVVSARTICDALLQNGVLSKDTHGTVLRFAPPLTITRDEIDWGMERIERVFARAIH
ncbi:ornithine--oxo-acid transaminase [Microvirga tunisiensis]|uniref:ornithine aminotransferase n=1 Tax=Microvirga tunisiensis TaxID=2108360 RepID=A0A5N7MR22_9HYPH|nr:ornithine--oxo-acid transaminase [Microvirga tunisiensis]MPR10665.1 ornithine--oxo-acid transaminase [Microvirga tunisiensis]MPR28899.1 ornithine--oxo-acid transaminase [Microvirga tunisiensis]